MPEAKQPTAPEDRAATAFELTDEMRVALEAAYKHLPRALFRARGKLSGEREPNDQYQSGVL
jgi:hypothetical protein